MKQKSCKILFQKCWYIQNIRCRPGLQQLLSKMTIAGPFSNIMAAQHWIRMANVFGSEQQQNWRVTSGSRKTKNFQALRSKRSLTSASQRMPDWLQGNNSWASLYRFVSVQFPDQASDTTGKFSDTRLAIKICQTTCVCFHETFLL